MLAPHCLVPMPCDSTCALSRLKNICLMCHTQFLDLSVNTIGDAGLTALAKAVESGALASLEVLFLENNQIRDAGLSALAEAVGNGALDQLEVCWRPTALPPTP